MKCPSCGRKMESGILRTESFLGGAKWLGLPHDGNRKLTIADPDWMGYVKISGFRCDNCRQMILNY
jgi:hypothetical protein